MRENVDLISKLKLETPAEFRYNPDTGEPDPSQPALVASQIADVAVHKNAAYLDVLGRRDVRARRLLLRRHQRPGEAAAARVRPRAAQSQSR